MANPVRDEASPILSIVTVHLDDLEGLAVTLASVRSLIGQGGVEWIVVDGGTEVKGPEQGVTMTEVREAATRFVSEPDRGIYDAMNKGAALATGNYVLYLNAGDTLHPEFDFAEVAGLLASRQAGMIWGNSWDRDRKGQVYKRKTRKAFWLRYGVAVCHQAVFFRRDLLGSAPFDTDYRIAADYDLLCRLYRGGSAIEYAQAPVCIFDLVGESSRNQAEASREEAAVRQKHFGVPQFLNRPLAAIKQAFWMFTTKFPRVRALLRRWI